MRLAFVVTAVILLAPLAAPVLRAQDEPVTAGSGGVAVPKRTKTVQPEYPPAAQAQGIRGIVILELLIEEGKVAEARVVRSVPGLDEAALAAARQWTYEVTKVNAKPVSVRLTVPITFAMKLPEMTRQDGIPELRQGIAPPFPSDARGPATVVAEVSLDPDGRVSEAKVAKGDAPWTNALLAALRTWRFAAEAGEATVSFRIQADFIPGERKDPPKVRLRLDGLQRSESLVGAQGPSAPPPALPAAPAAVPSPEGEPAGAPTAGAPAGTTPTGAVSPPRSADPAPPALSEQAAPAPPVEVISAPPPPPTPPEVESGASAVRDVVLEAGVPDLAKGRRPVPPPFARMAGTSGVVEVQFSVSAGGTCLVQAVSGPDLLKTAAEQTVTSWQFRRTQVHRLFLAAIFTYEGDRVTAVVRPQPPPAAPQALAQPQP